MRDGFVSMHVGVDITPWRLTGESSKVGSWVGVPWLVV